MLFNSLEFLVFFPIIVALYFALPHRFRWIMLLLASYYFYMCWDYNYAILLLITTTINYFSGIGITKSRSMIYRKTYLILGLVASLGILFFYKYFNFFGNSFNAILEKLTIGSRIPVYDILLPVGISFYTFQSLNYTIDVYMRKKEAEYHFGIFALYVSFFPQILAGPISRSTSLLPQFFEKHHFNYTQVRDGILMIIWGFFKKVVIADRLSEYVNLVYADPTAFGSIQLILATTFFTVQIYCDFSGYSDIAIGTAKIMGFSLMKNFNRPYFARSIREFWQRWHISLSTWFKDYLYIPLGGNRVPKARWYFNLFITFLISGLWHGANWTFVIWGALHGFYMVFAIWILKIKDYVNRKLGIIRFPQLHSFIQVSITFILVWFAWIFFKARSFDDALLIIKNIFVGKPGGELNLFYFSSDFYVALVLIPFLFVVEFLEERTGFWNRLQTIPGFYKWAILITIVLSIFILGKWEDIDFLYFQF